MALTVSQALFHASHSIGGAGEQSEVGGLAVLNYAGTYLCSSRAWRWLERQQVKLDLVKDQDYVWLPRGLLELVGYDMTQGLTTGLSVSANLGVGVYPGTPRPRLDIWPTPAATELDAITLYYRGGWSPIDEDTTLLPIPEWFEPLYIEAVRQVSRGFEMEDDAPMGDRMAALFTGPLYLAARRVDDGMAPDYGPLRGGAVEQQMGIRATNHWNFNSVSAPS